MAAARAGGAAKCGQQGPWVVGWSAIALIVALTLVGATAGAAFAADPGVWIKTSQLTKPAWYRQGLASNPATGE